MAYTSQAPAYDKRDHVISPASRDKLRLLDAGILASGSGYAAQTFRNDKDTGELGPALIDALNKMSVALANGAASYTGPTQFANDKNFGHLGPDLLTKLTAMAAQIKTLRP